jgi:16S rRNA processing protein RimM
MPVVSDAPWIVLAHLLRPQGRKGELLADLSTDFPERFEERPAVWLAAPGFRGPAEAAELAQVAAFWLPVGRNAGRIVLHLAGIDSIEQAERLAGRDVLVPLTERLPLDDESAYISDLVGCTVWDDDAAVGVVEDVHFPTTPDGLRRLDEAAPLLAVASPTGDEILIPFAKAFLIAIDLPGKSIRMTLPEGLVDINRASKPEDGL